MNDEQPNLDDFDSLHEKYKPLMIKLVRKYLVKGIIEHEDLFQEALITLDKARKLFDPERGTPFGIYLKQAISNSFRMYLRQNTPSYYKLDEKESEIRGKKHWSVKRVYVGSLQQMQEDRPDSL